VTKYLKFADKVEIEQNWKLFPNQNGVFSLASTLAIDQGIEEPYKDLCKRFHYDIKDKLLSLELVEAAKEFVKNHWLPEKAIEIIKSSL
jgi:hypothetical protein